MQKKNTYKLFAQCVVTQNEQRQIIDDAALVVDEGVIVHVGTRRDLAAIEAETTIELGNVLVAPGLINAHTHSPMTFFRGLADDLPLMQWLSQYIFPKEAQLTQDIVALGALLGCAEMTRTGTTAFTDMYLFSDGVCESAAQAGLRVLAGEVLFSFPSPAYGDCERGLALVESQLQRWHQHPLVRIAVMPHAVYTTTPELIRHCNVLVEKYNIPLHIHLAETADETEKCCQSFGKRPLEYCESMGILHNRTSVAHMVDVLDEEIMQVHAAGMQVVHNPRSNMKLASGFSPVAKMCAAGVCVGLGTDGAASNNGLNMFAEMSCAALIHKGYSKDATALPAQTVLDMATRGSAMAFGVPELGRLIEGAPADIIALDLSAPNMQPMYNPVSHLVYAATGHEVCFSMVNGEIVYKNGEFLKIDYPQLCREVKKLYRWVQRHAYS